MGPETKDQGLKIGAAECPGPRAKGKFKRSEVRGQRSEAVDGLDERIAERLESESYLALVRKAFRLWDQSDTDLKREYVRKLLVNAATTKLCDDDMVRLFLDWLESYHESHFKVIREVFQNPGSTRFTIWQRLHGEFLSLWLNCSGRGNFCRKSMKHTLTPKAYRICDGLTEGLIYFMIVLTPWAFGTTDRWSITVVGNKAQDF